MKSPLLLTLIYCALCVNSAAGQTKLALGLVLGGSFNIHTGSSLQKTATGVGFVGGGQADLSFSKSLALLTTIYGYDNRLGSYSHDLSQDGVDFTADVSTTIAYAGIEPLLKFSFPDDRFYLVAGPNIEFKITGRSDVDMTINTPGYSFPDGYPVQSTSYDVTDVNTRFELTFGGGYVFKIDPTSRLTAQLSFGYGLNQVAKNSDWRISSIRAVAVLEFDILPR